MQEQETPPETGAALVGLNSLDANGGARRRLTAADILSAPKRKPEVVDVPEWDGEVVVRALSGVERDQFEASVVTMRGRDQTFNLLNMRGKLVALSVVDPSDPDLHRRAFTDEQVTALGELDAVALNRVYEVAARLSGITQKDAEELAGNSDKAASGGSSPKSP